MDQEMEAKLVWIELHQSLRDHRKTMALALALDVHEAHAGGLCAFLWLWAVDNAPDGILPADPRFIARAAKWHGNPDVFVSSMESAGFLDRDRDQLSIHDWHEFAGKLIERRKANAERMREARAENVQGTSSARSQNVLGYSTVPNRTNKKNRSNDEWRESFSAWWTLYPRKVKKLSAETAWANMTPEERQLATETLPAYAASVAGKDAEFIAHPSTWLNGKRWEDELPTPIATAPGRIKRVVWDELLPDGTKRWEERGNSLIDRAAL